MPRLDQSRNCNLPFAILVMLLSAALTHGQQVSPIGSVQYTQNSADISLRGALRVDPSTLGMSFSLTLGNYPGRGINLPITINYSSKLWEVQTYAGVWGPIHTSTRNTPFFANTSESGWTSSLGIPQLAFAGGQGYDSQTGGGLCLVCSPQQEGTPAFIDRMNVTMPDGSRHELRQSDTVYLGGNGPTFAGEYIAVDGSRMRYKTTTKTLYLPDGSRYEMDVMDTVKYIDRNGNKTVFNTQTKVWTDTLGHAIPAPPLNHLVVGDANYYLPGIEDQTLHYVFRWKKLSDSGVQTTPSELSYSGDRVCQNQITGVSPWLFKSADPDNMCGEETKFNPTVLYQIVLPNTQAYTFTYNVFGEIDKVVLPTGGYETFTYSTIDGVGSSLEESFYAQVNRGVTQHQIHPDASTAYTWNYTAARVSVGINTKYMATEVTPEGVYTERDMYRGGVGAWYGYDDPRAGMTFEERIYSAKPELSGVLLRRTLSDWTYTGAINPGDLHASRDPRMVKQVELIFDTSGSDALAMTHTMAYDGDLNVIETKSYDHIPINKTTAQTIGINSIALGNLLRTEESLFVVNDESMSSTIRAQYRDRQMLSLPSVTRVKDPPGAIVAETQYIYDSEPLLTDVSATTWVDPGTLRGNVTKMRRWLNTSTDGNTVYACQPPSCANVNQPCLCTTGSWLETKSQYDQLGNLRKSWDAKNNLSQVSYDTMFNAYPVTKISPIPGGNGSTSSLITSMTYDFASGKMLASTDANGKITTYFYRNDNNQLDPLHRLQSVELPEGLGKIKYEYNDTPGGLSIKTLTLQRETPAVWLEDTVYFDGLGRMFRSKHKETANSSTKDTEYDQLSRIKRVSNPYFDNGLPTEWTTTTYDSLGRVIEVKTPDNAKVMTEYDGNKVTVTDQDLKQRSSLTDGLGRLIQVNEAPNTANYNYQTNYTYDVLGNLIRVRQGGYPQAGSGNVIQTRAFLYDSLSRLLYANNPEQDATIPGPSIAGTYSGTHWTMKYEYDNNGNLLKRTDARNIVTNYSYDALNRNTQVSYSGETGTPTPTVKRFYDAAPNGKGRLEHVETDNSDPRNNGQIAYSRTYINGYDALGRVTSQKQRLYRGTAAAQTWTDYTVTRAYDLAGHAIFQGYPSAHNVTYVYEAGGRLQWFYGGLGGESHDYSFDTTYTASGQMARETFGTTNLFLYHNIGYNNRLQMTETSVGTNPSDAQTWTRGRLRFFYSDQAIAANDPYANGTNNNGNVRRQEHHVPTAVTEQAGQLQLSGVSTSVIPMRDDYLYDPLNRLTKVTGNQVNVSGVQTSTPIYTQSFSYDAFGNRKIDTAQTTGTGINNKVYEPNKRNNRLNGLVYDAAGNVINESYTFRLNDRKYDAENRMTQAAGTNGAANYYVYDGDGRRVRRIVNGTETWQVYGIDGELLAEYAPATTSPQKEYGYRSGQLLITAEAQNGPTPPQVKWLVPDHLGTPRIIVDASGSLTNVRRHDYLPFGEELTSVMAGGALRSGGNGYATDTVRQKFGGQEREGEIGLDYCRARYYGPALGRFISPDAPFLDQWETDPQSWNLYSFGVNNPLRYTDHLGQYKCDANGNCIGERDGEKHGDLYWNAGANVWESEYEYRMRTSWFWRIQYWGLRNPDATLPGPAALGVPGGGRVPRIPGGSGRVSSFVAKALRWAKVKFNISSAKAVVHDHHIFPQQFRGWFQQIGIAIDDFTITLEESVHLRGVHGSGMGDLPGLWNQRWEEFIRENPSATAEDAYKYAEKLLKEYGLDVFDIHPHGGTSVKGIVTLGGPGEIPPGPPRIGR